MCSPQSPLGLGPDLLREVSSSLLGPQQRVGRRGRQYGDGRQGQQSRGTGSEPGVTRKVVSTEVKQNEESLNLQGFPTLAHELIILPLKSMDPV